MKNSLSLGASAAIALSTACGPSGQPGYPTDPSHYRPQTTVQTGRISLETLRCANSPMITNKAPICLGTPNALVQMTGPIAAAVNIQCQDINTGASFKGRVESVCEEPMWGVALIRSRAGEKCMEAVGCAPGKLVTSLYDAATGEVVHQEIK